MRPLQHKHRPVLSSELPRLSNKKAGRSSDHITNPSSAFQSHFSHRFLHDLFLYKLQSCRSTNEITQHSSSTVSPRSPSKSWDQISQRNLLKAVMIEYGVFIFSRVFTVFDFEGSIERSVEGSSLFAFVLSFLVFSNCIVQKIQLKTWRKDVSKRVQTSSFYYFYFCTVSAVHQQKNSEKYRCLNRRMSHLNKDSRCVMCAERSMYVAFIQFCICK